MSQVSTVLLYLAPIPNRVCRHSIVAWKGVRVSPHSLSPGAGCYFLDRSSDYVQVGREVPIFEFRFLVWKAQRVPWWIPSEPLEGNGSHIRGSLRGYSKDHS